MNWELITLVLYVYFYAVDAVLIFLVIRNDRMTILGKILTALVLLIPIVSIGVFFMLCYRIRKDLRKR